MNTYPLGVSGDPLNRVVPRECSFEILALVPTGESFLYSGGYLISICQAERHDLAEIMRLYRQASESHVRLDPRLAPGSEGIEKFRRVLGPMLGKRSYPVFVAREADGERLWGCVVGKVVDNKPFAVLEYGHISCLYVDEASRGREIGQRLYTRLRDWFKAEGVDTLQLDVSSHDPVGRHFWERRGFTYFLDHLYRDTEPAVMGVVDCDVVVRQADTGDMEAVLSLWKEMMDYHVPFDERLKVFPGTRRYIVRAIEYWLDDDASCLVVAENSDTVIGFTLGGSVDTGLGLKPAAYGHVAHMCITAKWRRRGIGRLLFARLRDWFQNQGLSTIHIYVSHFSSVSQEFWRALGFDDYIERLWCDL
jgi:ribosomal protein S18 acetylase RimI-like enzyme